LAQTQLSVEVLDKLESEWNTDFVAVLDGWAIYLSSFGTKKVYIS